MVLKSCAGIGAAMTFLALVTGSIWGKPTWGTWWVWDARITSMLVLLFLYAWRGRAARGLRGSRCRGACLRGAELVGTVNIPIIYKSVDWWYSLHQPASIKFTGESTMHARCCSRCW
jgi:heme exporter protein C